MNRQINGRKGEGRGGKDARKEEKGREGRREILFFKYFFSNSQTFFHFHGTLLTLQSHHLEPSSLLSVLFTCLLLLCPQPSSHAPRQPFLPHTCPAHAPLSRIHRHTDTCLDRHIQRHTQTHTDTHKHTQIDTRTHLPPCTLSTLT